jgi:hypothetical protein
MSKELSGKYMCVYDKKKIHDTNNTVKCSLYEAKPQLIGCSSSLPACHWLPGFVAFYLIGCHVNNKNT